MNAVASRRFFRALFAMLACLVGTASATWDEEIVIGTRHTIKSTVLSEDRKLQIYTPESYVGGVEEYPVLYLLDGPQHFHHTTGGVDFLARNGRVPEMIVVAIANTNRTRDLTPTASAMLGDQKMGGGANTFLKFLCEELGPWVDDNYRTRPRRVLVGHSFGGLFGVHSLITRPDYFHGIIAISPSMQWDDQHTVGQVENWLIEK